MGGEGRDRPGRRADPRRPSRPPPPRHLRNPTRRRPARPEAPGRRPVGPRGAVPGPVGRARPGPAGPAVLTGCSGAASSPARAAGRGRGARGPAEREGPRTRGWAAGAGRGSVEVGGGGGRGGGSGEARAVPPETLGCPGPALCRRCPLRPGPELRFLCRGARPASALIAAPPRPALLASAGGRASPRPGLRSHSPPRNLTTPGAGAPHSTPALPPAPIGQGPPANRAPCRREARGAAGPGPAQRAPPGGRVSGKAGGGAPARSCISAYPRPRPQAGTTATRGEAATAEPRPAGWGWGGGHPTAPTSRTPRQLNRLRLPTPRSPPVPPGHPGAKARARAAFGPGDERRGTFLSLLCQPQPQPRTRRLRGPARAPQAGTSTCVAHLFTSVHLINMRYRPVRPSQEQPAPLRPFPVEMSLRFLKRQASGCTRLYFFVRTCNFIGVGSSRFCSLSISLKGAWNTRVQRLVPGDGTGLGPAPRTKLLSPKQTS
ncbi:uncharacterized protein LOC141512039 [Macrotis lagotis]|uniref:uncharacterized protein LOC141512039 n=1 Tax=Macrotis lagotis TaxID=92651 RepID=UPI003D697C04